jgi:hypothetical protein
LLKVALNTITLHPPSNVILYWSFISTISQLNYNYFIFTMIVGILCLEYLNNNQNVFVMI